MNRTIRAVVWVVLGLLVGVSWASAQTSFRFVAWGDSRGKKTVNTTVLSDLSFWAKSTGPYFTLFQGDLCNKFTSDCVSDDPTGWKYAVNDGDPGNGMFDITFLTRGNHDVATKKKSPSWQAYSSSSGVWSLPGASNFNALTPYETYSFDYGNSHFVSVDVPEDVNVITPEEIAWLDADLTAAEDPGRLPQKITHTFLFWHGPFYCVDGHCSYTTELGSDAPADLVTVFNKHLTISATFHGHEHVNTHTHIRGDETQVPNLTHQFDQFVDGEAGAPAYSCDKTYRWDYCTTTPGFLTVDVNGDTVTVYQHLQDGSIVEQPFWTWTMPRP